MASCEENLQTTADALGQNSSDLMKTLINVEHLLKALIEIIDPNAVPNLLERSS